MSNFQTRLADLGIVLPKPSSPAANYVPIRVAASIVYVAGQLPLVDNQPKYLGEVPGDVPVDRAYEAARLCAINIVAQLGEAVDGDFERIEAFLRVGGFVRASPSFTEHAKVLNGASDLFVQLFGERGRHARVAVGVSSLPRGAPVEVDAIVAIRQ